MCWYLSIIELKNAQWNIEIPRDISHMVLDRVNEQAIQDGWLFRPPRVLRTATIELLAGYVCGCTVLLQEQHVFISLITLTKSDARILPVYL